MIGKLSGRIDYRAEDHVLLDVRGVGYVVYCSDRTMARLPAVGEHMALFTDLLVREDLLQLYGFTTLQEKEWFRLLQTVQGVGAKAALAMLGVLDGPAISRAIALGDWNSIKAAKGIGPKTAQRVVLELKDKAPTVMALGATLTPAMGDAPDEVIDADAPAKPAPPAAATPAPRPSVSAQPEALSALSNLGYAPAEAARAVAEAHDTTPDADTATLIRAALRLLAPKG